MCKITVRVEEKIGLPNYSNVTLEASAERWVLDQGTAVKEGYDRTYSQVEAVLRERREHILKAIGKQVATP